MDKNTFICLPNDKGSFTSRTDCEFDTKAALAKPAELAALAEQEAELAKQAELAEV